MFRLIAAIVVSLSFVSPAFAFDWPDSHTRTIILDNRCDRTLEVIVTFSPQKDVWEKAGWFELQPGDRKFPRQGSNRLQHRDKASALLYARSLDGQFEVKGDHGTNFGDEHVKSYKTSRLFRGKYVELRVTCD